MKKPVVRNERVNILLNKLRSIEKKKKYLREKEGLIRNELQRLSNKEADAIFSSRGHSFGK